MKSCDQKLATCADFSPIFYVDVAEKSSSVGIDVISSVTECPAVDEAAHVEDGHEESDGTIDEVVDVAQDPIFTADAEIESAILPSGAENFHPNRIMMEPNDVSPKDANEDIQMISVNTFPEADEYGIGSRTGYNTIVKQDLSIVTLQMFLRRPLHAYQPMNFMIHRPIGEHPFSALMKSSWTIKFEDLNQEEHDASEEEIDEGEHCYDGQDERNSGGPQNAVDPSILKGQRLQVQQDVKGFGLATFGGTSLAYQAGFTLYKLPLFAFLHTIPKCGDITPCATLGEPAAPHILCDTNEYGYCVFKEANTTSLKHYQSFEQELATGMTLRHQNLLATHGPLLDDGMTYFAGILTEYVSLGSLEDTIHNYGRAMEFHLKRSILMQVASGLEYMHSKGVVHNNLKPGTILLDEVAPGLVTAKISNFSKTRGMVQGLMSVSDEDIVRNQFYSDPVSEWNPDGTLYSRKSDVYSLGMVMLQTLAGEIQLPDEKNFLSILNKYKASPFAISQPMAVPDHWWKLIFSCLNLNPADRPSLSTVLKTMMTFDHQGI